MTVLTWWRTQRRPMMYGTLAGLVWVFLTAAATTPSEWLVYDQTVGMVHFFLDGPQPLRSVVADTFLRDFNTTIVQATLIFLLLTCLAGWVTWQMTRLQPRGQTQPGLWQSLDWYLVGLCLGGVSAAGLFRLLGLASWFKGPQDTPADWASAVLGFLLPPYTGTMLFFLWLHRLPSIRAPDWETHYHPKPSLKKPGGRGISFGKRKGGDSAKS